MSSTRHAKRASIKEFPRTSEPSDYFMRSLACPPRADDLHRTTRNVIKYCSPNEWENLQRDIMDAFEQSTRVEPSHPCAERLQSCNVSRLANELRDRGRWHEGCYTRTTLLHTEKCSVLLLCWPPGVSSPVHAHSDAMTKVKSSWCEWDKRPAHTTPAAE